MKQEESERLKVCLKIIQELKKGFTLRLFNLMRLNSTWLLSRKKKSAFLIINLKSRFFLGFYND